TVESIKFDNKIKTSRAIIEANPKAALLGFLNVVEENPKYFISPKGTYILYLLLSMKDEQGNLFIAQEPVKNAWIRYFRFKRVQVKLKLHTNIPFYCEFLVTMQIVLNRLGYFSTVEFFNNLFLEMQQPTKDEIDEFKPAFSFVLLQEKTLQGKSFDEMKDDYV